MSDPVGNRIFRPSRRWSGILWKSIGVVSGICGAVTFGAVATGAAPPGWNVAIGVISVAFGAGLGGLGVLGIYALFSLRMRLKDASREIQALVNVRPIADRLPLGLGGWAADAIMADLILRAVVARRPELVVECGSGWSTVLIARCLDELECGRVIALEHHKDFAEHTRQLLAAYGDSKRAEVIHAPLKERRTSGRDCLWYGDEVEASISGVIDLLIVDGPPADIQPESRYPAVPLLKERLGSNVVVILDDGRREDEARIARAWGIELDLQPWYVDAGKGIWIFERDKLVTAMLCDSHA